MPSPLALLGGGALLVVLVTVAVTLWSGRDRPRPSGPATLVTLAKRFIETRERDSLAIAVLIQERTEAERQATAAIERARHTQALADSLAGIGRTLATEARAADLGPDAPPSKWRLAYDAMASAADTYRVELTQKDDALRADSVAIARALDQFAASEARRRAADSLVVQLTDTIGTLVPGCAVNLRVARLPCPTRTEAAAAGSIFGLLVAVLLHR